MGSNNEKRAAFIARLKVDTSQQSKTAKQNQFASNNANKNSQGEAPDRQRSLSKGRGNGLYFAKKLLSKNKWIEEKQDFIDNIKED